MKLLAAHRDLLVSTIVVESRNNWIEFSLDLVILSRVFACSVTVPVVVGLCIASSTFAQEKVVIVHAPALDRDMFDGARHPALFVPSGAPPDSARKSVGIKVHLDASGHVEEAVVSRSSGSALLDEAARCWAQYEWLYLPSPTSRTEDHVLRFSREFPDERDVARIARSIIPDTPRPPYPYIARRLKKEGAVDLLLRLRGDGTVRKATVTTSMGFPLLDLITQQWAAAYWKLQALAGRDVRCRVVFSLTR